MNKFDEMYLREPIALQMICRNNLENIKLKDFTEVKTFFDEFERATNELKAAGRKIALLTKSTTTVIKLHRRPY